MEGRGNISWRNAKKEAATGADDDSESLVSGADEESVEYVDEYEEELVSDEEEYVEEEIIEEDDASGRVEFGAELQSDKQEKEPEAIEQEDFSNEVEPHANEVDEKTSEQIKEAEPPTVEDEKLVTEPVKPAAAAAAAAVVVVGGAVEAQSMQEAAAALSHRYTKCPTFECLPTEVEAQLNESSDALESKMIAEEDLTLLKGPEAAPEAEFSSIDDETQAAQTNCSVSSPKEMDQELASKADEAAPDETDKVLIAFNTDDAEIESPQDKAPTEVVIESASVTFQVETKQREAPKYMLSPRKPQSNADKDKNIGWEKPDWAIASPLKSKKPSVNMPISSPEKIIGWEKPMWTKAKLRSTGKDLKNGVDLQSPITHVQKVRIDDIIFEANPLVLKPTSKGTDVRLGENLAKPITHYPKNPMADINFVAIPDVILKPTDIGVKLKTSGDLQAPITHVTKEHHMDDINFEATPLILKSTDKGMAVRLGENLAKPITFIGGKKPSEETV